MRNYLQPALTRKFSLLALACVAVGPLASLQNVSAQGFSVQGMPIGAQSATGTSVITGYPDKASSRALSVSSSPQATSATFLFQGDDVPLGDLTISHESQLVGSQDTAWLQNTDAGYQAQLLLVGTGFSVPIEGVAGQADPSGALQSLISAALAQGYTAIPNGSSLRFIHALKVSGLPIAQKPTVQVVDNYTLQDAALGLGSSASGVGILRTKASVPAPATPKPTTPKPATIKPTTPKSATSSKSTTSKPVTAQPAAPKLPVSKPGAH